MSKADSNTPLVAMNVQSDAAEGLTVLRSYQLSTFSVGSTLRQEPIPITDGEIRTVPCYFAPQVPAEMLSDCERSVYRTMNRLYANIYRISYLLISILFLPFALMLPIFVAGMDYMAAYFRPMVSTVGRMINDVSPLLRYRTALARNALINSTARTLASAEEGKVSSSDNYALLV
jgi:hypothetical protein